MTIEEFYNWLSKQTIEDRLVHIRYKYSWEDYWIQSNEYLQVDLDIDGNYIWLNDWYEGQDNVEILGCIGVDDIKVEANFL